MVGGMVSPSKYCSTPNREYKVVNQRLIKDNKSHGASKHQRPSSSAGKYKPLCNLTFYLDVRSRVETARLESTLRSYGATIDIFFGKNVNCIVTDKSEWIGNGQSPAASISPITTPSPSSQLDQRHLLPRSRASAMLEKVSRQPSTPYSSPLALAQKWNIPIFSIPKFWSWIAQLREAPHESATDKEGRGRESLKFQIVVDATHSPFIKLESLAGSKKPELLELATWPKLHFDGLLGQCPFHSPSPVTSSHCEEEDRSQGFEVKDKVKVELIKYDTDFRIKENLDAGEETEGSKKLAKMNRRLVRSSIHNEDDSVVNTVAIKQNTSPLCNGHSGRTITRQTSQELLKVQCNGLTTSHRNSKLLSPSGSDVLPLPTSRRSKRRASASWCGSTRELALLSPTETDIENVRRSDSFDAHDTSLDSPGITLRPKGQLWLPIALIGTTAEENGNSIRKRYEYSAAVKQSDNTKFCNFFLDSLSGKPRNHSFSNQSLSRASKGSDSSLNSNISDQNEYEIKRNTDNRKETYCIITRNAKVKGDEMNGRESSVESNKSFENAPKCRTDGKKRSLSVGGSTTASTGKRPRTVSTNSIGSGVRKKKMSPEEKLLQDNKEYFKMEVLNVKLRSSGSLLNSNQNKDASVTNGDAEEKPVEKIEKIIIKKIKMRGKRKRSSWTKTSAKKTSDLEYTSAIVPEAKEKEFKINGIIRKKRQTELTTLCDEAESFMFGESSRQGNVPSINNIVSAIDDAPPDDSAKDKGGNISSSRKETTDENSSQDGHSVTSDGERTKRRKRRSQAEVFIHDNIDYYKFETPGSRLRYQGSLMEPKKEKNDFVYTMKEKKRGRSPPKVSDTGEKLIPSSDIKVEPDQAAEKKRNPLQPSEEVGRLLFAFENIPDMEPWYNVYRRQDEGMENYYPLLSDPCDQPFLLPYEMPKSLFSRVPDMSDYYKKKKKKMGHLFNHPRKSPRCHASTLAILSSLKKRKRRSGTNTSFNSALSESPQANTNPSEDKTDLKYLESETVESEDLLNFLYEDEPVVDVSEGDGSGGMVFFEPVSDSETGDCNGNEDDGKAGRTGNRVRKSVSEFVCDGEIDDGVKKQDSSDDSNPKQFSLHCVGSSNSCFDSVSIGAEKKSGLCVSVVTVLENFRNHRGDDGDADLISEFGGSSIADGLDPRRKKKKPRKINKTGWDNKKSRRRTGNKVTESKVSEGVDGVSGVYVEGAVTQKPKRIKPKLKLMEYGLDEENIIGSSKRRLRNNDADGRPMLRSRVEVMDRCVGLRARNGQEMDSHTGGLGSSAEYSPSTATAKKAAVMLRLPNGRFGVSNSIVLSKKRRALRGYGWTTRRR